MISTKQIARSLKKIEELPVRERYYRICDFYEARNKDGELARFQSRYLCTEGKDDPSSIKVLRRYERLQLFSLL